MSKLVEYRSFVADSTRWDGFAFRDGDVVISTPSKCGTTWTQTLVALLIFDGPNFPQPVNEMSLWMDMNLRPVEEAHATFAAQTHRRFIKTHTPLDGIPIDERVTYLVVGRDPRDAFVSDFHHRENMRIEKFKQIRYGAVGNEDLVADGISAEEPSEDPAERLRQALTSFLVDDHKFNSGSGHLSYTVHHLAQGWARRDLPNVHLFHYADYKRDLPAELARLAEALGVTLAPSRAAELADAASLDAMRSRAAEAAPDAHLDIWKDPKQFFRSGGMGEWRDLFTAEDKRVYAERVAELAVDDEFLMWLHNVQV